ncbi:MAG TPA: LolA-related protein [Dokdonella sp.]|uniref:LolA-related protein n=1 Tax=Dokdonella sp. TaxID=2291710 RepID=UPI002D7EAD1C|nr:LolA-related protein [Dokdonella sp.]HET9033280.1 LolA-related protein [Dokdonella sp.]
MSAAEIDPLALVSGLKRELPARTPYVEVRFSHMYDRALVARGELEYLGPGKLGKRVDKPYEETTTIADGQVTVQRGKRKPRQISLDRVPELEGFLRGFSALLGGDPVALQQDFDLSSSGDSARWQLRLSPKDKRLKKRIDALQVDGSGDNARCFSIIDADDDVSILMVEQLATAELPKPLTQKNVEQTCQAGAAAQ